MNLPLLSNQQHQHYLSINSHCNSNCSNYETEEEQQPQPQQQGDDCDCDTLLVTPPPTTVSRKLLRWLAPAFIPMLRHRRRSSIAAAKAGDGEDVDIEEQSRMRIPLQEEEQEEEEQEEEGENEEEEEVEESLQDSKDESPLVIPNISSNHSRSSSGSSSSYSNNNNAESPRSSSSSSSTGSLTELLLSTTAAATSSASSSLSPETIQHLELLLEETVFGWTHLSSELLGHILPPLLAYWIASRCLQYVIVKTLVADSTNLASYLLLLMPRALGLWAGWKAFCYIRQRRIVRFRNAYGTRAYMRDAPRRAQELQATDEQWNKKASRTKRAARRAKQLYTSYQQKCYQKRLSKARDRFERRNRKLQQRRQQRYTQHHYRRIRRERRLSITRDAAAIPSVRNIPYAHGAYFGAAPFVLADPRWVSILRKLLPDVYIEISRRMFFVTSIYFNFAADQSARLIHWAENNPVVAAYGALVSARQMQEQNRIQEEGGNDDNSEEWISSSSSSSSSSVSSVEDANDNDENEEAKKLSIQRPQPSKLQQQQLQPQPQPMVIPNIEWDIFLDPRLVRRVQLAMDARDRFSNRTKTMSSSETSTTSSNDGGNEREEEDKLPFSNDNEDICISGSGHSVHGINDDCLNERGGGPEHFLQNVSQKEKINKDEENEKILRYLDAELTKRAQDLTDHLLIAHGNLSQLAVEQIPANRWFSLKDWNYARVQSTRFTLGGGMYLRQWMAIFSEAFRLGSLDDEDYYCEQDDSDFLDNNDDNNQHNSSSGYTSERMEAGDEYNGLLPHDQQEGGIGDEINSSEVCLDTTLTESLKPIQRITQSEKPIGVVLDLKSRHVPKRVLSLVIETLQLAGIRVVGIGSFEIEDIRGVCNNITTTSSRTETLTSSTMLGGEDEPEGSDSNKDNDNKMDGATKEIFFVHSAGDLQAACEGGRVQPGDHVFFNGGSLIRDSARVSIGTTCFRVFREVTHLLNLAQDGRFDPWSIQEGYRIHPFGFGFIGNYNNSIGERHSIKRDEDHAPILSLSTKMGVTLADYKRRYKFSVGFYVQEFCIDETAATLLIELVNNNPALYDLGLAWGGVNGMTVQGIQPGRFTATDGFWNQRRLGLNWRERLNWMEM